MTFRHPTARCYEGPAVVGRITPNGVEEWVPLSEPPQSQRVMIFNNCTFYGAPGIDPAPIQGDTGGNKDGGARGGRDAGQETPVQAEAIATLDEEIVLWSRDLAAEGKGDRTRQNYESVIRAVAAPQLKDDSVVRRAWDSSAEFTRQGVAEYLTSLRIDQKRSPRTVNNHRFIIASFLRKHRPKCAYWFEGPERIRSLKVRKKGRRGDKRALLWVKELQPLVRVTRGRYRELFLVAFGTALRRGALSDSEGDGKCLRVKHFDLGPRPRVHVPAEVDKAGVARTLPLAPWVAQLIREIIARDGLGPDDMLFPFRPHSGTIRNYFNRAGIVKRNELGLAAMHSLKYSFNTTLAAFDVAERVRAELMSHAAESITDGIYLTPELLMKGMEEAVAMLPDPREPGTPECFRNPDDEGNPPESGKSEGDEKKGGCFPVDGRYIDPAMLNRPDDIPDSRPCGSPSAAEQRLSISQGNRGRATGARAPTHDDHAAAGRTPSAAFAAGDGYRFESCIAHLGTGGSEAQVLESPDHAPGRGLHDNGGRSRAVADLLRSIANCIDPGESPSERGPA